MYGSVNMHGVSVLELTQAIEALKADLFGGELSVPLTTADGTEITTAGGENILAVKLTGGLTEADVNAALSVAASGMAAQVKSAEKRAQEYADNAAAGVQANVKANHAEFEQAMAGLDKAILAV